MAVDPILAVAKALHLCWCEQVNLIPVADRPQRCSLMVGADFEMGVALLEDMCKCGTAWVRIAPYDPSTVFPSPMDQPRSCGPDQWSLTLELGLARCPPLGTANVLPTDAEWLAYTEKVMRDAQAMRNAILCCFGPANPRSRFLISSWQPFGPEGMCGGGKMTVQVQVFACDECA